MSDSGTSTRSEDTPQSDTPHPEKISGKLSLLRNQNLKSPLRLGRNYLANYWSKNSGAHPFWLTGPHRQQTTIAPEQMAEVELRIGAAIPIRRVASYEGANSNTGLSLNLPVGLRTVLGFEISAFRVGASHPYDCLSTRWCSLGKYVVNRVSGLCACTC